MKLAIDAVRTRMIEILSVNNTAEEAAMIAEVMLFADMSGIPKQGTLKLLGTEPTQDVKRVKDPFVEKDLGATALIDGGGVSGMLVTQIASDLAVKKCKDHGIAMV